MVFHIFFDSRNLAYAGFLLNPLCWCGCVWRTLENSTAYQDYVEGVKGAWDFFILRFPISVGFGTSHKAGWNKININFAIPYVLMMLQSGILIVNHNLIIVIILSPAVYIVTLKFLKCWCHAIYQAKGLLLRKKIVMFATLQAWNILRLSNTTT